MKRNLTIIIIALFAAWLISVAVLLCFLAQIVGVPSLVGAIVCQIGVAAVSAGLLLVTNTRVAWPDPYALDTAELLRPPLLRTEDRRMQSGTIDDRGVVQRLSDILEEEAARNPPSDKTPAWRIDRRADDTPEEP